MIFRHSPKPAPKPCGTCARIRAAALVLANKIANRIAMGRK